MDAPACQFCAPAVEARKEIERTVGLGARDAELYQPTPHMLRADGVDTRALGDVRLDVRVAAIGHGSHVLRAVGDNRNPPATMRMAGWRRCLAQFAGRNQGHAEAPATQGEMLAQPAKDDGAFRIGPRRATGGAGGRGPSAHRFRR